MAVQIRSGHCEAPELFIVEMAEMNGAKARFSSSRTMTRPMSKMTALGGMAGLFRADNEFSGNVILENGSHSYERLLGFQQSDTLFLNVPGQFLWLQNLRIRAIAY